MRQEWALWKKLLNAEMTMHNCCIHSQFDNIHDPKDPSALAMEPTLVN